MDRPPAPDLGVYPGSEDIAQQIEQYHGELTEKQALSRSGFLESTLRSSSRDRLYVFVLAILAAPQVNDHSVWFDR